MIRAMPLEGTALTRCPRRSQVRRFEVYLCCKYSCKYCPSRKRGIEHQTFASCLIAVSLPTISTPTQLLEHEHLFWNPRLHVGERTGHLPASHNQCREFGPPLQAEPLHLRCCALDLGELFEPNQDLAGYLDAFSYFPFCEKAIVALDNLGEGKHIRQMCAICFAMLQISADLLEFFCKMAGGLRLVEA